MKLDQKQIGRLAFREEGLMWNAYYAMPGTMDGAILLGSIAMAFVKDCPERKDAFMKLMTDAMGDFFKIQLGARPDWNVQAAPEIERGGKA